MLLSIKKYVPPAFGIAVASSAFERIAGIIKRLAITYERIKPGPAYRNAMLGRINKPELIIAPAEMQNKSIRPRSRLSLFSDFAAPIPDKLNQKLAICKFPFFYIKKIETLFNL